MPIEPWWETNPATTPRQKLGMVSQELLAAPGPHQLPRSRLAPSRTVSILQRGEFGRTFHDAAVRQGRQFEVQLRLSLGSPFRRVWSLGLVGARMRPA